MAEFDVRTMIAALADPLALLMFGVIVAATSSARVVDAHGRPPTGVGYLTPFGLSKITAMSREAVERAVGPLVRAGLLDVEPDDGCGYGGWRVNEAGIAAAAAGSLSTD